jgi:hypothetical protein
LARCRARGGEGGAVETSQSTTLPLRACRQACDGKGRGRIRRVASMLRWGVAAEYAVLPLRAHRGEGTTEHATVRPPHLRGDGAPPCHCQARLCGGAFMHAAERATPTSAWRHRWLVRGGPPHGEWRRQARGDGTASEPIEASVGGDQRVHAGMCAGRSLAMAGVLSA